MLYVLQASTAPGPLHPGTHAPVRPVKTLPSPLPTALSSPQIGLVEISEEGSAKPSGTPRFTAYEQRRTKFRKTRTASCSSSDASDEDSEGRKKRGGSTKSLHRGRDPQDPGGSGGTGGSGGAPPPGGSSTGGSGNFPSQSKALGGSGGGQGGSTQGHRQCLNGRHRRRAGETRLRESQSLNRITEVQEADPPASPKLPPSPVKLSDSTEVRKQQSKRNALIGRYLSLQRKLCLPLWGRGRLYKESRKDINQNLGSAAVAVAASIGMCHLHVSEHGKCCSLC